MGIRIRSCFYLLALALCSGANCAEPRVVEHLVIVVVQLSDGSVTTRSVTVRMLAAAAGADEREIDFQAEALLYEAARAIRKEAVEKRRVPEPK